MGRALGAVAALALGLGTVLAFRSEPGGRRAEAARGRARPHQPGAAEPPSAVSDGAGAAPRRLPRPDPFAPQPNVRIAPPPRDYNDLQREREAHDPDQGLCRGARPPVRALSGAGRAVRARQVARVARRAQDHDMANSTYESNLFDVKQLKLVFGRMQAQDLKRPHVGAYLKKRADKAGVSRPVRANREVALLSSAFSWALGHDDWPEILENPCLRRTPQPRAAARSLRRECRARTLRQGGRAAVASLLLPVEARRRATPGRHAAAGQARRR